MLMPRWRRENDGGANLLAYRVEVNVRGLHCGDSGRNKTSFIHVYSVSDLSALYKD